MSICIRRTQIFHFGIFREFAAKWHTAFIPTTWNIFVESTWHSCILVTTDQSGRSEIMTNIWPLWTIPADNRESHNCCSLQLLNIYFNPATLHLQQWAISSSPQSVIQSSINQHRKLGVNEKLMAAWHRQPHQTDNTTSKVHKSQNTLAAWQHGLFLLQQLIRIQIYLFESPPPVIPWTDTQPSAMRANSPKSLEGQVMDRTLGQTGTW